MPDSAIDLTGVEWVIAAYQCDGCLRWSWFRGCEVPFKPEPTPDCILLAPRRYSEAFEEVNSG